MKRFLFTILFLINLPVNADVAIETVGRVETLPQPFSNHWFWASDPILERVSLTNLDTDQVLGSVDGGWGITELLLPKKRSDFFYVPETHYSRGSRGERTDVLTIYETATLKAIDEVIIPPKRALNALPTGNATLTDDERFAIIFNMNPSQSVSVVDTRKRKFVEEISTPGCSLTYGAGARRFMMFCADGAMLFVTLSSDGSLKKKQRSEKWFDPNKDPLTEKGIRIGDTWYFISFEGFLYSINIATRAFGEPRSLISDSERKDQWRVGGRQFMAIHEASNTLFVLMHEGDVDTHKTGGTHLWTFDLSTGEKKAEYALESQGITFSGVPTEFGANWIWPFNGLYNWLVRFSFAEPHARPDAIVVTQEEEPVLILAGQASGSVAIYNALSMEFQYRVTTGNLSNLTLQLQPSSK